MTRYACMKRSPLRRSSTIPFWRASSLRRPRMRALIVGAGSVGGYFGSRLAAAERDVSFLVRPQRASQLARGLTILSQRGDTTVHVKLLLTGDTAGEFDVILLAVKAYQL